MIKFFRLTFISTAIILIICGSRAFTQGAWEIDYLPFDSINHSFLGKEIRVDFRSSLIDTLKEEVNVRKLLRTRDTVTLNIANQVFKFVEQWKVYVDHGILKDQTLESVKSSGVKTIQIKEIFIEAFTDSTITLKLHLYYPGSPKAISEKQIVVIEKSLIKGILVRF